MKIFFKNSAFSLAFFLIISTIILLVMFFLGVPGKLAYWISRLMSGLYQDFSNSMRFKIAYLSAILLILGLLVYGIKKIFHFFNWQESLKNIWENLKEFFNNNTTFTIIVEFILGCMCITFFYLFSFPYAFGFAAMVLIYFLSKYRIHTNRIFIIGLLLVILFWSPYLFQGPDAHVKVFDNLDCHIPQTKVLAESGKALSLNPHTRLDNFLNGLPLYGIDSGYNVLTWLFMLFPGFIAYAINDLLIRLVAFVGMILLLKNFIIRPEKLEYKWIIIGVSVCFACLPFYPAGGISIAGIPLLFYSFLNLLNQKERIVDYVIICIFPFYSKLALAGFFIAIILFIVFLIDGIKRKRLSLPYLQGLALLTVLYCFSHYQLLYSFFSSDFVSHREDIRVIGISSAHAIKNTIGNFLFDRVNVVGAQQLFVIGSAALAIIVAIFKKVKIKLLAGFVSFTLLTSFLWGFKYWEPVLPLREKFQLITAFDFGRFYWLNPFVWYLIFALSLFIILKVKPGKIIVSIFIIGQLLFMFINYNWEIRHLMGIKTSYAGSHRTYELSYGEFFSGSLFKEIQQYIHRSPEEYRVASLGLPPGITQYNGFYTLDIYNDVYPLEYKYQFRKIIEKELDKSPTAKRVFDENGKRCYLFAAELYNIRGFPGMVFTRGINKKESRRFQVKKLELNIEAFKKLGGQYILSAVEILNAGDNRLYFEKSFSREDSPWKIYLYRAL